MTEIAIGFGQGFFLVPTLLYAIRDVAPQQGTTAASLFNLSRVIGQTFGAAVIGSLITWREKCVRFNASEPNTMLARPGMSVETAIAVSTSDNVSATERGRMVGCSFDPARDIVAHVPTKLPEHPGLGRARPQGAGGLEVPPSSSR